jgi:hypothetical protein
MLVAIRQTARPDGWLRRRKAIQNKNKNKESASDKTKLEKEWKIEVEKVVV